MTKVKVQKSKSNFSNKNNKKTIQIKVFVKQKNIIVFKR